MPQSFPAGTLITLRATYRDSGGEAIDPTTPKLTLVPPRGRKLVLASELVHGATGVYSYELTTSTIGSWTGEWSGTVNGKPVASLPFKFTVRARL